MNLERRAEIKEKLFDDTFEFLKERYNLKITQGLADAAQLQADLLQLYIEESTGKTELISTLVEKHKKISDEVMKAVGNYQRVLRVVSEGKDFINENFGRNLTNLVKASEFVESLEAPQIIEAI